MSNFAQMADEHLHSFFSDFHKDVCGFRPNASWHRDDIIKFCEQWSSDSAQAELKAKWAEEEEYFRKMEEKFLLQMEEEWLARTKFEDYTKSKIFD